MTKKTSKNAATVATGSEENSSDRSSHGAGGYSADYSGSASDEEGPSSGSGSDDNTNMPAIVASGTALNTLQSLKESLPVQSGDCQQPSCKDGHHQQRNTNLAASNHAAIGSGPGAPADDEGGGSSDDTSLEVPNDTSPMRQRSNLTKARLPGEKHSSSSSSSGNSSFTNDEPLVQNPMDPRIDISAVQTVRSLSELIQESNNSVFIPPLMVSARHARTHTNDSYQRLMEVCWLLLLFFDSVVFVLVCYYSTVCITVCSLASHCHFRL